MAGGPSAPGSELRPGGGRSHRSTEARRRGAKGRPEGGARAATGAVLGSAAAARTMISPGA
eukprot:12998417-Alexandrium_andersonii.AAC.1